MNLLTLRSATLALLLIPLNLGAMNKNAENALQEVVGSLQNLTDAIQTSKASITRPPHEIKGPFQAQIVPGTTPWPINEPLNLVAENGKIDFRATEIKKSYDIVRDSINKYINDETSKNYIALLPKAPKFEKPAFLQKQIDALTRANDYFNKLPSNDPNLESCGQAILKTVFSINLEILVLASYSANKTKTDPLFSLMDDINRLLDSLYKKIEAFSSGFLPLGSQLSDAHGFIKIAEEIIKKEISTAEAIDQINYLKDDPNSIIEYKYIPEAITRISRPNKEAFFDQFISLGQLPQLIKDQQKSSAQIMAKANTISDGTERKTFLENKLNSLIARWIWSTVSMVRNAQDAQEVGSFVNYQQAIVKTLSDIAQELAKLNVKEYGLIITKTQTSLRGIQTLLLRILDQKTINNKPEGGSLTNNIEILKNEFKDKNDVLTKVLDVLEDQLQARLKDPYHKFNPSALDNKFSEQTEEIGEEEGGSGTETGRTSEPKMHVKFENVNQFFNDLEKEQEEAIHSGFEWFTKGTKDVVGYIAKLEKQGVDSIKSDIENAEKSYLLKLSDSDKNTFKTREEKTLWVTNTIVDPFLTIIKTYNLAQESTSSENKHTAINLIITTLKNINISKSDLPTANIIRKALDEYIPKIQTKVDALPAGTTGSSSEGSSGGGGGSSTGTNLTSLTDLIKLANEAQKLKANPPKTQEELTAMISRHEPIVRSLLVPIINSTDQAQVADASAYTRKLAITADNLLNVFKGNNSLNQFFKLVNTIDDIFDIRDKNFRNISPNPGIIATLPTDYDNIKGFLNKEQQDAIEKFLKQLSAQPSAPQTGSTIGKGKEKEEGPFADLDAWIHQAKYLNRNPPANKNQIDNMITNNRHNLNSLLIPLIESNDKTKIQQVLTYSYNLVITSDNIRKNLSPEDSDLKNFVLLSALENNIADGKINGFTTKKLNTAKRDFNDIKGELAQNVAIKIEEFLNNVTPTDAGDGGKGSSTGASGHLAAKYQDLLEQLRNKENAYNNAPVGSKLNPAIELFDIEKVVFEEIFRDLATATSEENINYIALLNTELTRAIQAQGSTDSFISNYKLSFPFRNLYVIATDLISLAGQIVKTKDSKAILSAQQDFTDLTKHWPLYGKIDGNSYPENKEYINKILPLMKNAKDAIEKRYNEWNK